MHATGIPQFTLAQYENDFQGRHRLHDVVAWWAARRPNEPAVINHDRKQTLTWAAFDAHSAEIARRLLGLGFHKGDFFATALPFFTEHILLEYAFFRIGVIVVPLDLRLRPAEVTACISMVHAKGFAGLPELCELVRNECTFVEHVFPLLPGAEVPGEAVAEDELLRAAAHVTPADGALVIFTTGSTGSPKPALLSHRSITCQNLCLGGGFGFYEGMRMLTNLPASHVGGQTEALMTPLFWGGTAVVLEVFDAGRSLAAISEHKVNILGQIPAMFHFEWRHADYPATDLSSLEIVLYGGQQVSTQFLERMATMAPQICTGLGLTEASGFCTYTPRTAKLAETATSLGHDMPIYPMSIREPMRDDGSAGGELAAGEIGNVCFRGPQTFLGYVNDPAATARAISSDGFLYTGDLGFVNETGLHLSGRVKWVIKPAGYQVFPGDVESHFAKLEGVANCGAVGGEHRTLSEAVVAFIECKPGAELTVQQLKAHARSMASYMRPLHYVLLEQGQIPLNRAIKTDYVRLSQMAKEEIEKLRAGGRWDS